VITGAKTAGSVDEWWAMVLLSAQFLFWDRYGTWRPQKMKICPFISTKHCIKKKLPIAALCGRRREGL
jgi:hypothetical protein